MANRKVDLKSFIIGALRRATYRWPPRSNVFKAARRARGKYECVKCEEIVGRKEIKMDHVLPVVDPAVGFVDWNTYIPRMYPLEDGFQPLCKTCHDAKTLVENAGRKRKKK